MDYFFRAPDDDMERWKRAAGDRGQDFSVWLREAAESLCAMQTPGISLTVISTRQEAQAFLDANPELEVVDAEPAGRTIGAGRPGSASTSPEASSEQTPVVDEGLVERAERLARERGKDVTPDPK